MSGWNEVSPDHDAAVADEELAPDLERAVAVEEAVGDGDRISVDTQPAPVERVPLLSLPDSLRSVDVRVGGRAVRGLVLVAAVFLAVLAGRWWWVEQDAGAVPVEPVSAKSTGAGPAGEGSVGDGTEPVGSEGETEGAPEDPLAPQQEPGPEQATAAPATVVVHVVGQVHEPGVVRLEQGARVADAVGEAGGFTAEADQASLNLARPVADGEQVWVGAPGEEPPEWLTSNVAGPAPGSAGEGDQGGGAQGGGEGAEGGSGRVGLNTATSVQLQELPGVGPATADKIIAWREEHGRFSAAHELLEISGIGERTYERLEPLVVVD